MYVHVMEEAEWQNAGLETGSIVFAWLSNTSIIILVVCVLFIVCMYVTTYVKHKN